MLSRFAKSIYKLSLLTPYLIGFTVIEFVQHNYKIGISLLITIFLLLLLTYIIFMDVKESMLTNDISIDSCDGTYDKWIWTSIVVIVVVIYEAFIIINNIGKDDPLSILVVALVIMGTIYKNTDDRENILLKIIGYKMYRVTSGGITYVMFSKKNIRNLSKKREVYRILEDTLLEVE